MNSQNSKEMIIIKTDENNFITSDEFEKLQNQYKCKVEYNNGEIILHSDTSLTHNSIVSGIQSELRVFFRGSKCKSYTEQIEVIFKNSTEEYKFKPDIFIMCEDAKTKGESFISSPKIIFEVVSKNYAQVDYITKLQVYQKFGVLEYNIVEQNGHIVQYVLEDGIYGIKNTFHLGDIYTSTIFSDLKIDLSYIYE